MTIRQTSMALLVVGGLTLPAAASSQSSADTRYCAELIRLYRTYVNNPHDPRPAFVSPSSAHETAIVSCQAGNTAAGIPVREKVLLNNKFTLSRRGDG